MRKPLPNSALLHSHRWRSVSKAMQLTAAREASSLVRGRATLGDFELTVCTDGTYLLDGGAMFGVVPKTLWQKRIAPNADNEILLGLHSVVVRTGKQTVVIETGIGNKQTEKMRGIFENQELLMESYAA